MGHYDSCREADEAVEEEKAHRRRADHFLKVLENRSFVEISQLIKAYEDLALLVKDMSGTRWQHRQAAGIQKTIDKFHERR